ncbi:glycosyltransferase [Persephonella sp.]
MRKIILYTPRLLPGGVTESNKLLAKGFAQKGYKVIIVANKKTSIQIENFPHYYLNANDIIRPLKLKKIIYQEKPIAIFSNMLPQNVSLSIAKLLTSRKDFPHTKYFGFVRNSSSYLSYKRFYHLPYRLFVRKLYKNLNKIIAVSSVTKKDLKKAFFLDDEDITVIHNPLDIEHIDKLKDEPLNTREEKIFRNKTILFVGRLEPQKRIDLLLDVFHEIYKISNRINLVIVGEGREKDRLISKAKELEILKNVYILPFTKNPFKYMKNASVFVLTSQDEGFGRVVAESLACGTPVIAYENEFSGHKDIIIHSKNGFLIPFGNKDLMVKYITKVIFDERHLKELKKNTILSVEKFSLENIIIQLEKLIFRE